MNYCIYEREVWTVYSVDFRSGEVYLCKDFKKPFERVVLEWVDSFYHRKEDAETTLDGIIYM